ncbi:MAG: CYTH domain-containing protein [bacterium]|nr:CYTH domain-containing protein [bacterium]
MNKSNEEIEVVFLNIDKALLEKKLSSIGATKTKEFFYKHSSFDFPDYRLDKDNSWIRLRDEGGENILAFKKRLGVTSQDGSTNDEGMEEVEIRVDAYEQTKVFLKKIGLIEKHEAEKKRIRYEKESVIFDIDTWPEIPTFLEIEAPSWEEIDVAINLLGYNPRDKKICSVNQIYKLYGKDVNDYQKISFDGLVKK